MTLPFLDSNILLRHLLGDHPDHSPRATAYMRRIARGELSAPIADSVIVEVVFTLERGYKRSKADVRAAVLPLMELPGLLLPDKARMRQVFDLYMNLNISFVDAYHAALMRERGLGEILSFDSHFNRVPGLKRTEP